MFLKKAICAIGILAMSATMTTLCKAQEKPVLSAMKKELSRTMTELASQPQPPFFLSYSVTETRGVRMSASFGKIEGAADVHNRILDIDLRVGDYQLDNTHPIRGASFEFGSGAGAAFLPLGNDETALRSVIWSATDRSYKAAMERYGKVVTNMAVKVREEDTSADLSREKAYSFSSAPLPFNIDTLAWKDKLRRLSAVFASEPWLYDGNVYMQAEVLTKYFVNSEGTEVEQSEPQIRVFATARTKADDGMTLPLYRSYFAFSPENLPSEAQIAEDIRKMILLLKDLRTAPLAETYTGPAILSGEASGVFFHEIFGHRVEGHRQKDANSSQTFKAFVGKKILPDFIDVVFDPTIKSLKNQDIVGYFKYDDEGMPGEKVTAVEKGIFKDFLMSRAPIEGFETSNGHGRRQAGYKPVSRQSNLLVQSSKSTTFDNLREQLRFEAKRQGKEYGLYFVEISGGFTFTGRTVPNAFNVQPLVVYKIFADGRPDQLVRGVDLIGTPLTTFNNITAAADDLGIFNGVCGAESGGVPVSASSPSLLVSTIEVQKKSKSQAKLPILPAPAEALRGGN
ncbi:MAG: TldD/PmbA family protein [Bacteroidota bacterium]